MILVIYRILYGTDFLERSMRSVYDEADKIFVGYSSEPWSRPANFPDIRDIEQSPVDVIHKHFDLSEEKIMVMSHQRDTPAGEFNYLYNWAVDLLSKPDIVNGKSVASIYTSFGAAASPLIVKVIISVASNVADALPGFGYITTFFAGLILDIVVTALADSSVISTVK